MQLANPYTRIANIALASVALAAFAGCDHPADPIPNEPPKPIATAASDVVEADAPKMNDDDGASAKRDDDDDKEAEAEFKSVDGMKIRGEAELEETAAGVVIEVAIEGAPVGQKGLHIHETDNCSDIPNKSMGGHFSPEGAEHGLPKENEHHLGDLGNITIDAEGKGKLSITVPKANLKDGDKMSFIGKSVVLHESNDKGTGDAGNAGKPIACAPIKRS